MSLVGKIGILMWFVDAFLFVVLEKSKSTNNSFKESIEILQWLAHMAACILSIAAVIGF